MATKVQPFRAERLPAAEAVRIDQLDGHARDAMSEARAMIEVARRETSKLREMAEAEKARRKAVMVATADKALADFLDGKRVERDARASAALLSDAASVRQDFDALIPWLTDFLRTAVGRLVGEIGEEEVFSRLVVQGVADLKRSRGIALVVHPDTLARVEAARVQFPDRFSAVERVTPDGSQPRDRLLLEGDGGFVDLSLDVGVDALCAELTRQAGGPA